MIPGQPVVLAVDDPSAVGEARRTAAAAAARLGFDETARGRAALVATEVATNLFKHAAGGQLIVQEVDDGRRCGLEVVAIDRGPGIADLGRCLADGFSTAGSSGHGLGAISRLASSLEIHSVPGLGTALVARLWLPPAAAAPGPTGLDWGALSLPMPGEEVCGDAWAVRADPGRHVALVVDGLGHGPQAAAAAREAVRVFHDRHALGPEAIVREAHEAMRSTRGAAMAVALLDPGRREVRYCGVGNIAAVLIDAAGGRRLSMVSHNGTVGHAVRKVQEFTYPWPGGALLVMHSDGLTSHWQLERYPGLASRHPALVAGTLFRDCRRDRDDATVLVAREQGDAPP